MNSAPPDIQSALSVLGLTEWVEPTALRRAYLRTIKVRKPETDPEGFRQAREAYDLLVAWGASRSDLDASAEEVPPEPPVLDGWAALPPLAESGQVAEARRRMRALLLANVPPPTVRGALMLLLDLQRADPGPDAQQTLQAYLEWMERAQVELAFAHDAERLLLLKELARLPASTPLLVQSLIAGALLTSDFSSALQSLEAFAITNPVEAQGVLPPLRQASPLLHQLLTPALTPVGHGERTTSAPASSSGGSAKLFIFGCIILARLVMFVGNQADSPPRPSVMYPRAPSVTEPATPRTTGWASPTPPPVNRSNEQLVRDLCDTSLADCFSARAVLTHVAMHDCAGAQKEFLALAGSKTLLVPSNASRTLQMFISNVQPLLGAACQ